MRLLLLFLLFLCLVTISEQIKLKKPGNVRVGVVKVHAARKKWRDQPVQSRDFAGFDYLTIPKSMSTMMKLVLCDLVRRQRRLPQVDPMIGEKSPCVGGVWNSKLRADRLLWKPRADRPTIIIFREPIERFVSMYSYLCKQKNLCGAKTSIHLFAKRVYAILQRNRIVPGFKDGREVFRHIQPSFWFAYNVSNSLPPNPLIIYSTLDRDENADQLRDAFIKGNVPPRAAAKAVAIVRKSFGNTIRTAAGKRDAKLYRMWETMIYQKRETLLYVLASYYNDYRLLKIALPEKLLQAAKRHGITLPDPIQVIHGRKIIKDSCENVRRHRTDDGRAIPLRPC